MPGKRILVIEDDPGIRRNLKDLLESEGYQVDEASNGVTALELLLQAEELPSLILLDLTMPTMDGYAFRAAQENDSKLAVIPIAVMTADGHIESKKAKIGAHAFVRKPIEVTDLLAVVERYCS